METLKKMLVQQQFEGLGVVEGVFTHGSDENDPKKSSKNTRGNFGFCEEELNGKSRK